MLGVLGMLVPLMVTSSASAAGVMEMSQTNGTIDLNNSDKSADDVNLTFNSVQPGDVLVLKIDPRLWSSTDWPTAGQFATYGTVKFDEVAGTATYTFENVSADDVANGKTVSADLAVSIKPVIDNSEVLNPRDSNNLLTAGEYSLDATLTHTDSSTESQAVNFTITDGYSVGNSWDQVVFTNPDENKPYTDTMTYQKDALYKFTVNNALRVTYPDNVQRENWNPNISRITLSMPADFELDDSSAATGWTQDATTKLLTYDPTVSGASATFSGRFTAAARDEAYEAQGASSVQGYFGTSTTLSNLDLANPVKAKIVSSGASAPGSPNPADASTSDLFVNYYDGTPNVLVPGSSTAKHTEVMSSAYSLGYNVVVPGETIKDLDFSVAAPDGSRITGGKAWVDNPVEGQTYTLDLETADGRHQIVRHQVTSAEADAKKATIPIDGTGNTWVKASFLNPDGMAMNTTVYWSLNFAAQKTYEMDAADSNKDLTIADGDVRYPTILATGTGVTSGKKIKKGYPFTGDSYVNPVTYYKVLRNADLGMAIDSDSSNVDSTYSGTVEYLDGKSHTMAPQMNAGSDGSATSASETTANTIYEPVFYMMLPKKTVLSADPSVDSSIPQPKITTYQTTTGHTVVKFDWKGTGWSYNTRTDSSVASGKFHVQWKASDEPGITTTSPAAVWLSNMNDPDLTVESSSVNGNAATKPVDSTTADEATGGDGNAVLIGSMNVTVNRSRVSSGISSSLKISDNAGSMPSDTAINVLTTTSTADHSLTLDIANYQSATGTTLVRQLTNLPENVDIRLEGAIALNKTDGTTTDTASDASVLYSASQQELPSGKDPLSVSEKGYVTAENIESIGGWSAVKSFIVDIPESVSGTEYTATIAVTDASAATQTAEWALIRSARYATGWSALPTTLYDSYVRTYGTKTWEDGNDADNLRPTSVTVHLLNEDGTEADTATASADTDWKYQFEKAKFAVSEAEATHTGADFMKYALSEDAVAQYKATINGLNVTNVHKPAQVDGDTPGTSTGAGTNADTGTGDGTSTPNNGGGKGTAGTSTPNNGGANGNGTRTGTGNSGTAGPGKAGSSTKDANGNGPQSTTGAAGVVDSGSASSVLPKSHSRSTSRSTSSAASSAPVPVATASKAVAALAKTGVDTQAVIAVMLLLVLFGAAFAKVRAR